MTPQSTTIRVADGKPVLNLCANNYLGLAQHSAVAAAAKVGALVLTDTADGQWYGQTVATFATIQLARRLVSPNLEYYSPARQPANSGLMLCRRRCQTGSQLQVRKT